MSRKRSRKPDNNENRSDTRKDSRGPVRRKPDQPPVRLGLLQPLIPKTRGQEDLLDSIRQKQITICDGVAGTGKTFLSFGSALHARESDKNIKRVVIVRPTLPAGDDDDIGFLPGSLEDKMGPFVAPLIKDSAPLLIEADVHLNATEYKEFVESYLKAIDIEIVPLAFLRGRTFNNAFIILDEAQNCTEADFKLFLTRIGKNSKVVIEGDSTQSDREDGYLSQLQDLLADMPEIGIVHLEGTDIVRNPLISDILRRFD